MLYRVTVHCDAARTKCRERSRQGFRQGNTASPPGCDAISEPSLVVSSLAAHAGYCSPFPTKALIEFGTVP